MPSMTLLRRAAALALTLSAVTAAPAAADEVAGEVVVRFKPGANLAAVQREIGLKAPRTFAPHTRAFTIRDGESVDATVKELRALPEVATAAPNQVARLSGFIPNDDGGTGETAGWQTVQWNFLPGIGVNAPDAWQHLIDVGRGGGRGVTVAVLDTGVAYSNRRRFRRSPDFARGDFARGYDFVDDDSFPNDENGHGTHVAGTIGERTDNGIGVTGLAYGAKIMPVRVLDRYGGGDSVTITAGIRYAVKHGADVINLSFEFDDGIRQSSASEIPDILAALRYARRHNVLVVAAAGNQSRSKLAYPARYDTVMAVGAITENGCHASYSNVGRPLDIVAPGGGPDDGNDPTCDQTKPTGRDIFQMTYHWAGAEVVPRTASYRRFGLPRKFAGTSMAAPHVSAAAALVIASRVLGRRPTPQAVEERLKATAIDAGAPGFDSLYGYGRLDAGAATAPLAK
jgi:serine protease